jgi:hypothetical protein
MDGSERPQIAGKPLAFRVTAQNWLGRFAGADHHGGPGGLFLFDRQLPYRLLNDPEGSRVYVHASRMRQPHEKRKGSGNQTLPLPKKLKI